MLEGLLNLRSCAPVEASDHDMDESFLRQYGSMLKRLEQEIEEHEAKRPEGWRSWLMRWLG